MSAKMGRPTAGPALRDADALQLVVLGPPLVRWGERVVAFRTRKEFALLVYLALTRIPQPREHLTALLWPDRDAAAARNLLRTTLSRLRQHLAAAAGTTVEAITLLRAEHDALGREVVHLARDGTPSLTLDAELVEAGASQTGEAAAASDLEARLQAAAAVYRGAFLEGLTFDDAAELDEWVGVQRAYWQDQVERVLGRLATLQLERRAFAVAIATAKARRSASIP